MVAEIYKWISILYRAVRKDLPRSAVFRYMKKEDKCSRHWVKEL